MKKVLVLILLLLMGNLNTLPAQPPKNANAAPHNSLYQNNRAPLRPNPYIELPLGAIKPRGWLKEMLVRQKNGATGQPDKLYPQVMGTRNGWLDGDGDPEILKLVICELT